MTWKWEQGLAAAVKRSCAAAWRAAWSLADEICSSGRRCSFSLSCCITCFADISMGLVTAVPEIHYSETGVTVC